MLPHRTGPTPVADRGAALPDALKRNITGATLRFRHGGPFGAGRPGFTGAAPEIATYGVALGGLCVQSHNKVPLASVSDRVVTSHTAVRRPKSRPTDMPDW